MLIAVNTCLQHHYEEDVRVYREKPQWIVPRSPPQVKQRWSTWTGCHNSVNINIILLWESEISHTIKGRLMLRCPWARYWTPKCSERLLRGAYSLRHLSLSGFMHVCSLYVHVWWCACKQTEWKTVISPLLRLIKDSSSCSKDIPHRTSEFDGDSIWFDLDIQNSTFWSEVSQFVC